MTSPEEHLRFVRLARAAKMKERWEAQVSALDAEIAHLDLVIEELERVVVPSRIPLH